MKIFKKERMLSRLEDEGRLHLIDDRSMRLMTALDGMEAVKNRYKALVLDEEEYYVRYQGTNYPVNPKDCIES